MKKIYILISLLLMSGLLFGCSNLFEFTTTERGTFLTSTKTSTTETYTIDQEQVLSDIYAMIYEEVYEDVRNEVLENISEERFDTIYADIVEDLLEQILLGEITVTADTIVDMINSIENGSSNAVVGVTNYNENHVATGLGSGVIYKHVDNRYWVVTNNHVVEDGTYFEIVFEDGTTADATLRGVDDLVDVAVLYFYSDEEYEVADFADSDAVTKGDIVLAVGNPSGYDFFGSMTMGIVSGVDRFFDIDGDNIKDMFVNYIQHDAAINSGNSGGALFDINGDVIGINVIKIASTTIEGMGFAIPSNLVSAICSDIEEYGYSLQKPVLGINFIEIRGNEDRFEQDGIIIPEVITDGFYIFAVNENASFHGYVQAGDIITEIAGITLTTSTDFVFQFSQYRVGDIISIVVYRDGGFITIENIELKANPR